MSVSATQAWRAWVNGQAGLVGPGNPLALGAYLSHQASPDTGAYAVGSRASYPDTGTVAEAGGPTLARISALVYAGTVEAAEDAAAAYATAVQGLTGVPQACGDTGVKILVHDNLSGPMAVPEPSAGGEQFCFEVAADFLMAGQ